MSAISLKHSTHTSSKMKRIYHYLAVLSLVAFAAGLQAQTPSGIVINGALQHASASGPRMCNEAGTITFGQHIGQSNDVGQTVKYLCLGDMLFVNHNNDSDLSGDPQPATQPGIGYVFYDCPPTQTGPNLATVLTDPCINDTDPIIVGGTPFPLTGGMWVATQSPNGDITLNNNGGLQTAFNNGVALPIQFWFAPITLDQFSASTPGFENGGPCVDVNTDEAFSIVYLNAITASNQMVNQGASGCEGSFVVRGGLPEFDNNTTDYDITISLQGNPAVTGTTSSVATHGSTIQFVVPQPGIYVITIEDGKSCGATFTMDMSVCQAVTFSFPLINASPGTNICVPLTIQDFVNVGSMQFTMVWDGTILDFTNINAINGNVTGLDVNDFNNLFPPLNDTLTFTWADLTFNGVDLNDGETLFEVCFDVIGSLGECSPLNFSNRPTPIEVGDPGVPQPNIYGFLGINGKVNISNDVVFLVTSADSVSCPGLSDGSFTATVAAGTPPYQLTWRRLPAGPVNGPFAVPAAGSMFTANNLQAGLYEVTVMDANNPMNVSRDTAEILSGPVLGVQIQGESPNCFGESNGSVTAVVTLNGVATPNPGPGYTYQWNTVPDPGNVPVLTDLPFGFYAVTVTDPSGCTAMASATLSQPAPLTVTGPNTNITNATCEGAENGAVSIMATGGTSANGTYTFSWDNGLGTVIATNSQVGNLDPGQYCVTVSDDNGCLFNNCYTVNAQKVLDATPLITDASCNGIADGEIFVTGTATGAAAVLPYTFTWSQVGNPPVNNNTSSQLTGLAAGDYVLTLTDSDPAGCEIIRTFTVNEPQPLVATILEQVNETCVVGSDGSITVGVTGGTFPYTYDWSHDAALQDSIATGLTQNTYTVDITDANGCTGMLTANILAPTPPSIVSLLDDTVSCPEDTDGSLTVNAAPGGAPIAGYAWTGGGVTQTINNLAPGTYFVTVTAEDGCSIVDTAQVLAPLPLTLDSTSLRLPDCPGDGNGRITVFASGGTLPYTYTWSTTNVPGTLNPLPGLTAGSYSVTVTDANGCDPLIVPITLPDPPSIQVSFSAITQVSCPDDQTCDGGATATAIYSDGTTGQFNFTWSSGETAMNVANATASQLCRGAQSVTVSDGVCGVILPVTIPSPQDITIGVLSTAVSCNGLGDGSITLTPAGGTGPFDFLWSPSGQQTPTINGLIAGVYSAIVTDANGCTRTQNVEISEPDELILSIDPSLTTPTVSCADGTDGVISVVFNSGQNINPVGNAPFTWSNGIAPAISSIANNLSPGTYSVTITDIKGCRDSLTYTISEPPPLIVVIVPPVAPLCFGEATQIIIDTIYGGTGTALMDYTYQIDNNGLSFPPDQPATVFAGPHIITVEDPAGCRIEEMVNIDQPAEIQVILPAELVVELGDSTARLEPIVVSSLPIDSYLWTPDTYLSSDTVQSPFIVELLESTDYNLLVTDINGCTGTADIFVELDANRNVFIPNVFSPNGDGPNDEFRIFACTGVTSINSVKVFDRWGGQVYEASGLLPVCEGGLRLWDGRKNGRLMNPGVYVYLIEIEFLDRVKLLYRGDVTLLR